MDIEEVDPPIKSCSIICTHIPTELLNKNAARIHFRQFGRVVRMIIRPRSRACIIEYDCPENAQMAILNGGEYKGHVFSVNWHESQAVKKKKVKKDPDPDWVPDLEIQEELDAMAATGASFLKKTYNLRPEGMSVDVVPTAKQPLSKVKKTLKRNWKTEATKKMKPKTKSVKKPNVWTPEQLELLHCIKQPALTTEEKFKVLEARDKLIRLRTKKEINLKNTTATVGTCPDMCPEKERLMRVVQHQVALYEQDSSGKNMNPALAIKQYSRSSADQETPLPHELRPVSVLQLTMGYLMHRIMNLCDASDVNFAEWYHFLWDRTRSIRKDITQQELCCQGSVALLEQCARFHIHCSARLAGEDPSVFDQKINTENLTKCLQTLKYMYDDLNLKGESCPNESEFRAYIILLNLNDGNFMWEVQQLKPEIQKSPEVKFALTVYSAIDKNNYIKFFKLVNSTEYLNACILLRYFIQVRTKALFTILKCYSPRAPYTQFPLHELEKLLSFEDSDSVVDFIVAHGLYLNPEETHVVLDKKNFQVPELPYPLDRAVNVVESKRKKSVGEIVCGGPLPPPDFETYAPCNSFNENGVLNITGVLVDIKGAENIDTTPSKESNSEDQSDSSPIIPNKLFQSPKTSNIFTSKFLSSEEQQRKSPDPSLPFWSIKTDSTPTATNIFKSKDDAQSASIFGKPPIKSDESFKQFTFKPPSTVEQQKTGIFGEQPKSIFSEEQQKLSIFNVPPSSSIFNEQPKASIFGDQSNVQQKPHFFTKQSTSIFAEQKQQSIFSGSQKPTIFTTQNANMFDTDQMKQTKPGGFAFDLNSKQVVTPSHGGFAFDIKSNKNLEEKSVTSTSTNLQFFKPPIATRDEVKVSEVPKFIGFTTAQKKPSEQDTFVSSTVTFTTTAELQDTIKAEKSIFKSAVTSVADEKKKAGELEKARLEELERQRKIEKEKEEKLEREIEEKKRKEELLRKQKMEEEEREKERKRRELEKQRVLEEFALRIEIEVLMNDLLKKVEENVKQQRLKEISRNVVKQKMLLFIDKWKRKSLSNKRKRQAMDQNPIWLPSRTTTEEALQLYTDNQDLNLLNIKRYKCGKSDEILLPVADKIPKMNVKCIYKTLMKSYMRICERLQKEMFWKVTVSLPDFREFKVGLNYIEEVLTDIFQWKDRYGGTSIVNQYIGETRLNYAIEKKQGVHPFEGNSNGLIFISYGYNELLIERIKEGFKNYPTLSCTPVILIFINNNINSSPTSDLIEELNSNKHVLDYEILSCKFTSLEIMKTIDRSLVLLAEFVGKPPPLKLNTLQLFLHTNVATELWKRMSSYAAWNSTYKKCLKSPNVVISLYNEAVEKLKGVVLDKSSLQYSDFPDDFDKLLLEPVPDVLPCDYKYFPSFWKSESYRCLLLNTLNTLKFPKYQSSWPSLNEKELERDIFNYCSEILRQPEKAFFKVIAVILKNIDPTTDFNKIEKVLWTNVIEVIVLEKLKETDFSLQHTEFNTKSIFQQLFVIYNKEGLNSYLNDEWFYLRNPVIECEIKQNSQKKKTKVKEKITEFKLYDDDFDLDELEKSIRESSEKMVCDKSKMKELQDFMTDLADLEESIVIQKKICSNFEKNIQKALDIGG